MKTKNIVAILMASIIAMAMFAPTAMAIPITIDVPDEPPQVICKCEYPNPVPAAVLGPESVTICAVVCDPNGKDDIANVYATVYKPNGEILHATVDMEAVETCGCTPLKPEIGNSPVSCDRPIANDPTCQLFESDPFEMTINEPGGDYRVVVTATDTSGQTDKLQNRLKYISVVLLEIDFEALNFEDIVICEPSYVMGDDDMDTEDKPTIHNAGNDPMQVGIEFGGFYLGDVLVETIKMDAKIPGGSPAPEVWLPLGSMHWFEYVLAGYCDKVAVDFSLHVEEGTAPGQYEGEITIEGKEAPHTILLEDKDARDDDRYEPYLGNGKYGTLTYDYDTCEFDFAGHGLTDGVEYCLIYYTDDYPGTNGWSLGSGTASGGGDVTISGNVGGIPSGDLNYDRAGSKNGQGKIWLVPCSDYSNGDGPMSGWHPENILFEMETICCGAC